MPDDDHDATLTALLPKVKTDDEARQEFVDILELMGPTTRGPRATGASSPPSCSDVLSFRTGPIGPVLQDGSGVPRSRVSGAHPAGSVAGTDIPQ